MTLEELHQMFDVWDAQGIDWWFIDHQVSYSEDSAVIVNNTSFVFENVVRLVNEVR